jgi:rod shape-determining protein MreC
VSTSTNTSFAKRRTTVRRAVLAGLVVLCVVLFTAYFRESSGGALHDVQDAAGAAVAPLQSVANKAIEPFQDAWDWTAGLVDARDRAADLERQNQALRGRIADERFQAEELQRLRRLTGLHDLPTGYRRVYAGVIQRSPVANWYPRATLDVGTSSGVVENSPVVAAGYRGAALVGVITSARSGSSVVTFITDPRTEIGATVQGAGNPPGILRASTSGELQLENVPSAYRVDAGDFVITAGFGGRLLSVYPRGLPIGQVASVGGRDTDQFWTIQVSPLADVRSLDSMVALAPVSAQAKRRAAGR